MNTTQGDVNESGFMARLAAELKALGLMMLYFACWLVPLIIVKNLLLEEYQVPITRLSVAVVGALVLSKVVLVLEHVSLGDWVANRPAWVDVILRTLLYGVGVAIVLLLEKAFEGRHEHGGFWPSLGAVLEHRDINHVWINLICISAALFSFNVLAVLSRHFGEGGLLQLFGKPLPPPG